MKRASISLLLAALLFSSTNPVLMATDWSAVVKQVERSVVWANIADEGGCTAWVINQEKHYLATAAHCYPEHGQGILWVDSVAARVVLYNKKVDVMVVEAKDLDPSRPALKLASKNPTIGQEVMSAGYGFALERPFFRAAHVQDDKMALPGVEGGPFISTDTAFVGGQSGGPVVDGAGDVVMLVQRGDGGTTGLGVGAETLQTTIGRFFEKKK